MPTKTTASLSLPSARTVRGYDISRMSLGRFLAATEELSALPARLLARCFPDKDAGQALRALAGFDADMLLAVTECALTECADDIIRVFAQVSGVPEAALRDDPQIGLDGLAEMIATWWEVNNLANFTRAVKTLKRSLLTAR